MVQKISIEQFIELAHQYPILDVRSPGEYSHAHIPGAYSLPLFTDEERKLVGTAYKQQSREIAIKIGLDYFGVKMRGIVEEVEKIMANRQPATDNHQEEKAGNKTGQLPIANCILVHCWRGGMRSAGVAWLLDLYGFKVYTLNGGYKMYRRWTRAQFEKEYNITIIGGYTGSGKTIVLHELKRLGNNVIDLEGLANHKGSAFGAFGEKPQPSQEMFENLLAGELAAVSGAFNKEKALSTGPVYIEDESQRIGLLNIPNAFWNSMRKSYTIFIDIPFEERLNYLTAEYGNFNRQLFADAIMRIQKRLGGLETKTAIDHLLKNNLKECFRVLLSYYDKCYSKALTNKETNTTLLNKMSCPDVDMETITATLINKRHLFNTILSFLFFLPSFLFCQSAPGVQHDLTGIWKGSLYNDTTKKYLPYQIAISEDNGKISGYSYTLFDIDGKAEWGIKKIKIKQQDDAHMVVEDVALIANDYSEPPPKKVRVLSIVQLTTKDSLQQLTGTWSTNQTREYSPLTGTIQVQRILNYRTMVLFEKLVALKLATDLSFVKAENKSNADIAKEMSASETGLPEAAPLLRAINYQPAETVAIGPNGTKRPSIEFKPNDAVMDASRIQVQKAELRQLNDSATTPADIKANAVISVKAVSQEDISVLSPVAKTVDPRKSKTVPLPDKKPQAMIASAVKKQPVTDNKAQTKAKNQSQSTGVIVRNTINEEKQPVVHQQPIIPKTNPVTAVVIPANNNSTINIVSAGVQKKEIAIAIANVANNVSERKTREAQAIFFESDSLVLTLYDNGDVDGDTVSVIMNGQIIFARQGLSTIANNKTIYFDKGMPDSLSMIMYAENLGSIPPNTGVLIIMDGEKRYEVRFSADLTTNASILFRRKPKIK